MRQSAHVLLWTALLVLIGGFSFGAAGLCSRQGQRAIEGSSGNEANRPLVPAESNTVQTPSRQEIVSEEEALLHDKAWWEDPEQVEAITASFNQNFNGWVTFSTADCERKQSGTKLLTEAIWNCGGTTPGLQVRLEDFAGLREDQKLQVAYLLQKVARYGKKYGSKLPDDLPVETTLQVHQEVFTKSLAWPPEIVMNVFGVKDMTPEDVASLRATRVEFLNRIAPELAQLDYLTRFSLKAAMANDISPEDFNTKIHSVIIAPIISEYQISFQATCEEFFNKCQRIGK